jgi:hypothetical protein
MRQSTAVVRRSTFSVQWIGSLPSAVRVREARETQTFAEDQREQQRRADVEAATRGRLGGQPPNARAKSASRPKLPAAMPAAFGDPSVTLQ